VTLTAVDNSGNTAQTTAVVTIQKDAPIVKTKNITVLLNAASEATILPTDINNGTTDICGALVYSISKSKFDCSNVGENTITITVTDNSVNVTSQQITVTVLPSGVDEDFDGIDDACDDQIDTLSVVIPSGFTPNADNINDYFQILGLDSYASKTLEVFNRYGNQVYESPNYANQWDGTLLDTGEPLPDATYYYVLTLDGKLFKGYVYINRVK
jgi:gliding motility-associated-like protein